MKQSVREKICREMQAVGLDCMFITPSSDMIYVLGTTLMQDERFNVLVLPAVGKPFAFVNRVYQSEVESWEDVETGYWSDGESPWNLFREMCKTRGISMRTAGVGAAMPSRFLLALQEWFPDTKFLDNGWIMDRLRPFKQEEERRLMREACRRCNESLEETIGLGRFWIGKTEGEFDEFLCREMRKRKIDHSGAMVCYGKNAAIPHYMEDDTVIEEGGGLLVDFGGSYGGYCSDMSRTFYFSKDGREESMKYFATVYEVVLEALLAGCNAAVLGNPLGAVDRATRNVIEQRGYGKYFTHRTGHGIGIDTHERPNAEAGETASIQPGMAFSIEPGIYIPGEFGIRIEEQALMTEEGLTLLHDFTRKLMII